MGKVSQITELSNIQRKSFVKWSSMKSTKLFTHTVPVKLGCYKEKIYIHMATPLNTEFSHCEIMIKTFYYYCTKTVSTAYLCTK